MIRLALFLAALACVMVGCGGDDAPSADDAGASLPTCDTRAVFFVQRCGGGLSDTAQCKLYASAPAGSMATGCTVPVVNASTGAVTLLECVEACQ